MTTNNHNFDFRKLKFSATSLAALLFFIALCCDFTTVSAQAAARAGGRNAAAPSPALASPAVASQSSAAEVPRLQLSSLEGLAARAKDVIDVELDGAMLRMAIGALGKDDGDDDPEDRASKAAARRALANLKGVYVKGFEFTSAGQYTEANLAPIKSQLSGGGWKRLASVTSRKPDMPTNADSVEVFAATDAARPDSLSGLAVLITGEKKLMIVQIVGAIDPAALGGIASSFNLPQLNSLRSPAAPPAAPTRPR